MPSALADGWLIGIVALSISICIPFLRFIAGRWKESRDEVIKRAEKAEAQNILLKDEAVKRTEEKYYLQIENMLLKTKLELCESNLGNWESGRWERGR